jgi:hypothetical protein
MSIKSDALLAQTIDNTVPKGEKWVLIRTDKDANIVKVQGTLSGLDACTAMLEFLNAAATNGINKTSLDISNSKQ